MLTHPICVYINWAAYDELSDNVELTEELAMRQLDELLRLRRNGVRLDYYLMDAFWYAPDGAYRAWRKPHWPNGPDAWLDKCLSHGVLPGLWVAGNSTHSHDPVPAWRDSLTADGRSCCLFSGGFFNHFLDSLDYWHRRGARMFKFDFMNLGAAPPALERAMLPSDIRAQNSAALVSGLKRFRQEHPGTVLLAYNGFDEPHWHRGTAYHAQSNTSLPFRKTIDARWLEAFDALYCGDPRPADAPAMAFWRAKDIYSDHMTRVYELNGIPLPRIDNSGFMIGTTGTCYYRRAAAWQGMLLLSLARGGWANTYYGNLDLLDDAQASWFARAQALYLRLQEFGRFFTFGALPGEGRPYGFAAIDADGVLFACVNPSQAASQVKLPGLAFDAWRVQFRDAGFEPRLDGDALTLGPEQLALVGAGRYADPACDLGVQEDVVIPRASEPLSVTFAPDGPRAIIATLAAPASGRLRVILRQTDANGVAKRTTGGSPPGGVSLGKLLILSAEQDGRAVPVAVNYDKAIWSGLSWAAGEIDARDLRPGVPVTLRCETREAGEVTLSGEAFAVRYS
jgi:hypothetical protein